MMSKSLRSTGSLGMNRLINQNITAAPRHRVNMYPMGDTHSSSKSLVTGTPKPKITLASITALCACILFLFFIMFNWVCVASSWSFIVYKSTANIVFFWRMPGSSNKNDIFVGLNENDADHEHE